MYMGIKKIKKKIKISNNLIISNNHKCFIVAEISANHSGSLNILKKTMLKAKQAGADAVKIQTYQAETMTLNAKNKHFLIDDNSIWKGKRLYDLYKKAETPFKWHKEIFKFAKKNNIICFSAPFDISSVELLKKYNCPIYKVASPEIEDQRLIEEIAKTKKPVIISTGIADENNIRTAINICKKAGNYNIILLNCISSYPAKNSELNLKYINLLKKFTPIVGYSDHSNSDLASIISVAKGAKVIEKHFILSQKIKSPDKSFSYNPIQLKNLIKKIRDVEIMLGSKKINKKKIIKKKLKTVSRSIFYSDDIKKGEKISLTNIQSVRPGTGLSLSYFKKILGKKVKKNCKFGQPTKLKDIIF
jgi:pseudaminic acid synthase